jgi:hypothetical protein
MCEFCVSVILFVLSIVSLVNNFCVEMLVSQEPVTEQNTCNVIGCRAWTILHVKGVQTKVVKGPPPMHSAS